jgi:hypothetical protein
MKMRPEPDTSERDSPEALLAGTLCLMSCATRSGCALYARKIADNLDRLSAHPALSQEMRTVCRRLACEWEQRADGEADAKSASTNLHEMLRSQSRLH